MEKDTKNKQQKYDSLQSNDYFGDLEELLQNEVSQLEEEENEISSKQGLDEEFYNNGWGYDTWREVPSEENEIIEYNSENGDLYELNRVTANSIQNQIQKEEFALVKLKGSHELTTKSHSDRLPEISFEEEMDRVQIPEEPITEEEILKSKEEEALDKISKSIAGQIDFKTEDNEKENVGSDEKNIEKKRFFHRLPKVFVPAVIIFSILIFAGGLLIGTKAGQSLLINIASKIAVDRMKQDDGSNTIIQEVPDDIDKSDSKITDTPDEDIIWEVNEGSARHEDYCINILLLGEEAIGSDGARGRTDLIMIATLNTKEKWIRLTSMMRDMLVQIPGYQDNKLNAAYQIGGVPLLMETLEVNFDIQLDGYCLVGFNSFEKIVDILNGVDITLTKAEADYLNVENYISNPKNRNVKPGVNHMNGNQALGYCRVRYVGTGNQEYNDFGRTSRHQIVLNAVFEKYKSLGYLDLITVMYDCLPFITTDLTSSKLADCIEKALEIGLNEVENLRIPVEGMYESGKVRKMAVLIPYLPENTKALHEFIFGNAAE